MYKVGDRVKVIRNRARLFPRDLEGRVGTVVFVDDGSIPYAIKFEGWHDGHDCQLVALDLGDSGYWLGEEDLELVKMGLREARPGDILVDGEDDEYKVFFANEYIAIISEPNLFTRSMGHHTWDELEHDGFNLKDQQPDDKMQKAMELLKSNGFRVEKD